ncbi:acetate--CoA ligase family protein [Falsiroseomonas tokyonensis]|uniref:Acetate--CoA ligase family protein n=1 Tax=Falsiroseomonas tokyonensis TaxID=430521 RepID=A0ABV7BWC5_9PROT|nr:acetate--CoA ligase [Falsiroseomonas tokyonensis]MBU8538486.1 acetate--CoA ligase family protein [Falsiroseomonas tokyonensis]
MSLAQALLNPRRVALIGASADEQRLTARPQRYLRRHGFSGELFPVNPRAETVLGERAYASLADIPGDIDFAYILLGTDNVEAQVAACAARKIPVACVLADGFAESGPEGAALQSRVLAAAQAGGMRLLGPNSMGIVNLNARTALTTNAALEAEELPAGRVALVSQSGSMMGALLSRGAARGLGFSHLVGTGNEADLTAGEIASLLLDDPDVDVVALFLESMRAPEQMAAAAAKARALKKPIVALKLGRSPFGAELATSHTGALAGSDAAADAFFRAHGILRVSMLESLLELPLLVAGRRAPAHSHRAVSVMTTTGGGGALAVDALGVLGIEARKPDAHAAAKLEAAKFNSHARLLDLTLAGARPDRVMAALDALRAADDTDLVLAVIGSSAQFRPKDAVAGIVEGTKIPGKPVAAFLAPQAEASLRLLAEAGIAAFRTAESAADCINAYCAWQAPRELPDPAAPSITLPAQPDEADARRLFAALGLASPFAVMQDTPPSGMGYPVALKILSPDIAHKTEVGGVVLNLPAADALREAAAAMRARVAAAAPSARITGLLVQQMRKGLAEAILGFRRDPEVGPVVLLGAGGVLSELHRDIALRLAPVDLETAREMIAEVRALKPLSGWRNLPKGDLDALAEAVVAASRLASVPQVAEAEINPLIVGRPGEGVTVADAWVVLR